MASKLKVDELRKQLARRGLDTSGTKPALVHRLESAIREEEESLKDGGATAAGGKKRGRDSEDTGNPDGGDLIGAVEKLREMNVQQLREEAVRRGISSNGLKKELLKRLCEDVEKEEGEDAEDETDESKDGNVGTKEKIITATKKGAAVLDQWLPDQVKIEYHVLQVGDEIYDAMLNQTNVGHNNNKFYVIQVLESDGGGTYMVYTRWGRVGVKGQDNLQGPFKSQESAIQEFQQKFFAKTKNHWSNRKGFICHPKSYTWLEMDYSENEKELSVNEIRESTSEIQPCETKLDPCIAKFISLICNISMMKQQMMEIGYNAEKLPLGKLSKSTILKGYEVLKRISDVIGLSKRSLLEQLSGEFYTVIPHDFGFKKMREFVIDTPQKLKSKLEMVEALGEIELATKLLEEVNGMQEDPLYSHYQRLHCELSPVEADSEEFSMFSNTKNRKLLWHGSRLTNWTGILSQGLRIAPPEAPVTGYMFGKGVYFADMFSKSANYCYASNAATTGVLLLCEVALGDMAELLDAKYDADNLPEGKLSTKGVGQTEPNISKAVTLDDGVVVPLGKPKHNQRHKGALLYNEYIVYNVDQIRMRYVVQVNFRFKY
ncbi:poly [ADP-ribose] polymerase 2-like isoform X2 [Momordica charantia]|uniref:Poly [ADP-ribose] polymerase n=1 Tax=Momordica charantia TaxID=3673 RepID=A0A6J1DH69_MOMCH|nr:poly [ADP-ribose] polymerase 2-like isoform X2 [Momordica charantia]